MVKSILKALVVLLCLVVAIGAIAAAKYKPWTEWTLKDADKMLWNSPWGQTQVDTDTSEMTFTPTDTSGGGDARVARGSFNQAVSVNYRICFLSAKPIRQAFARKAELDTSRNTPEQVKAARAFIDSKYDDRIVVAVDFESGSGGDGRMTGPVFSALSSAITNTLKNSTYLELKGGKRLFLQEYQVKKQGGVGYLFIFPRLADGKPFIDPKAGEVRFYSELPNKVATLNMRFKIADFMYDGVLEY